MDLLSRTNLAARAKRCNDNGLCFVSLQPLEKNTNHIMLHSEVGEVMVNDKFIHF